MQWNEELFHRRSYDSSSYSFGRKIDFILKDSELNTNEFKKKDVSAAVAINQQVKNLRDNAAVLIESNKLTKDDSDIVNGIDFVGDVGYMYKLVKYQDVIVATPVSKLVTPCDITTLKLFDYTSNSLYYLKVIHPSQKVSLNLKPCLI